MIEKKTALSIVLPCYNEAENLPLLLERFVKFYPEYNFELLLVNNGSTDNSAQVLSKIAAVYSFVRVVNIENNVGYGHGIHSGLSVAEGEFLCYSHADVQTPPEDVFKAFDIMNSLAEEKRGKAFIKGFRTNKTGDILTRGLELVCFLMTGYHLSDINGQPKLFHRTFFQSLSFPPTDFSYDAWIFLKSEQAKQDLHCFAVRFGDRLYGVSKSAPNLFRKWRTIMQFFCSLYVISRQEKTDPRNLPAQFFRFLQTGILTNVLNYLCFILCLHLLEISYLFASATGFFGGFVAGFFLNRNYTFRDLKSENAQKGTFTSFAAFGAVNVISLLLNLLMVWACVEIFAMRPELAQFFGIALSAMCNFLGCRLFVF